MKSSRISQGALVLALALCTLSGMSRGSADQAQPVGVVVAVSGQATVFVRDKKAEKVALGQSLFEGDRIRTGSNGRLSLVLTDGSQLKVNYDTDLILQQKAVKGEKVSRAINSLKVLVGDIWAKITHHPDESFVFDTPSSVAAIKGSEGQVFVGKDRSSCYKWLVDNLQVGNQYGMVMCGPHQQTCVAFGSAPDTPTAYNPGPDNWYQEKGGQGQSGDTIPVELLLRDKSSGKEQKVILNFKKNP